MFDLITPTDSRSPSPFAVLKRDSHLSKWCREKRSLFTDETVAARIIPLLKPGDHVIDVGTSIGDHTVAYALAVGAKGRVHAFEPFLPAFMAMAVNCRDLPQVTPYHVALGAQTGLVGMSDDENAGSNHVVPGPGVHQWALNSINFPKRVSYLKLDCEGYEPNVIQGGWSFLHHHLPIIFCELNRGALARYGFTLDHIIGPLVQMGYRMEFLAPEHNLDMEQLDVFFFIP